MFLVVHEREDQEKEEKGGQECALWTQDPQKAEEIQTRQRGISFFHSFMLFVRCDWL